MLSSTLSGRCELGLLPQPSAQFAAPSTLATAQLAPRCASRMYLPTFRFFRVWAMELVRQRGRQETRPGCKRCGTNSYDYSLQLYSKDLLNFRSKCVRCLNTPSTRTFLHGHFPLSGRFYLATFSWSSSNVRHEFCYQASGFRHFYTWLVLRLLDVVNFRSSLACRCHAHPPLEFGGRR